MFWEILNLKVFRKANWSPRMVKVLSFGFRVPSFELPNDPRQKLKNSLELKKSHESRVPELRKMVTRRTFAEILRVL